jgi:hypothetical protein
MIKGACPVGWAGWPPDPQPDKADISERRITRGRIGAVEAVCTSCANKRTLHYEQLHSIYVWQPGGVVISLSFQKLTLPTNR